MLLLTLCMVGVVLALVCVAVGYRWGCEDTRLALSKPARRVAERAR